MSSYYGSIDQGSHVYLTKSVICLSPYLIFDKKLFEFDSSIAFILDKVLYWLLRRIAYLEHLN